MKEADMLGKISTLEEEGERQKETIESLRKELAEAILKCDKQAKLLANRQIQISDDTARIRELETKASRRMTWGLIASVIAVALLIKSIL